MFSREPRARLWPCGAGRSALLLAGKPWSAAAPSGTTPQRSLWRSLGVPYHPHATAVALVMTPVGAMT